MIKIAYTPALVRQYNKLDKGLQDEVKEKITLFRDKKNHATLKVHKLHGDLKKFSSFSVDYKTRIVFYWLDDSEALLEMVGDHDVYR